MQDDDLTIPAFMDRKTWDKEQWKKSSKAWDKIIAAQRRLNECSKKKELAAKQAAKELREAKERSKAERKALQDKRNAKRKMRQSVLGLTLSIALDKGSLTAISLKKVLSPEQKPFAQWALRKLTETGKLKRKGKKVYHV